MNQNDFPKSGKENTRRQLITNGSADFCQSLLADHSCLGGRAKC